MPGSIIKRSKSSWTVVVDLGRDPVTGQRRRAWQSVKGSKREAERLLTQLLHQRDQGIDVLPGKISVADYLRRWLEDYARPNTAPKTFRTYTDIVNRHLIPALGAIPLAKLRPAHIQAFYSQALKDGRLDGKGGVSPRTVLRFHQILHVALRHARKWQVLASNPADDVEPPRVLRSELRLLPASDVRSLMDAADATPYGCLVHLAVSTGMRLGELLGLPWSAVDLEARVLHVHQTLQWLTGQGFTFREPKTQGSRRQIALTPSSVQRLREHRRMQLEQRLLMGSGYNDHDLVFTTALGTPIEPSNLRRTWLRIVKDAGLGHLRFHDLRHAHASLMLQQGVHPKIVSERLGHAGVGITLNVYSHVLPGLQQEAADQFDRVLASS